MSHSDTPNILIHIVGVKDKKVNKKKSVTPDQAIKMLYEGIATLPKSPNQRKILSTATLSRFPMFNPRDENLYLVSKFDLFISLTRLNYRFPNQPMFLNFQRRQKQGQVITEGLSNRLIIKAKLRKLDLMVKFLSNFDLVLMEQNFINTVYHSSDAVGRDITSCQRPSYIPQFSWATPYYTRKQLVSMGLNQGWITKGRVITTELETELCQKAIKNDISAKTLLNHYYHIVGYNSLPLIQYYTLQGSYFMNQYLRQSVTYKTRNKQLEQVIDRVWWLIKSAPAFDNKYTIYRFIKTDDHLSHLQIGDIYTPPSFVSTTRDPFYQDPNFGFGFILIKIKLPKNVPGIGLCLEGGSLFSEEQEIILPPRCQLRLENKHADCQYFHTDRKFASRIEKRYEFTLIGTEKISLPFRPPLSDNQLPKPLDFTSLSKVNAGLIDRVRMFLTTHANEQRQFGSTIGKKSFTFMSEWYDSTTAYMNHYALTTERGFLIYTIYNHQILLQIELGVVDGQERMAVNYNYINMGKPQGESLYTDDELLKFVASVGYYFDIHSISLFCDFVSCNGQKQSHGAYCLDMYNFFKTGMKRFGKMYEIKPMFSYDELELLGSKTYRAIIKRMGQRNVDEIYRVFKDGFVPLVQSGKKKDSFGDFYVWIADNHCHLIEKLEANVAAVTASPLDSLYYEFDGMGYLYNRGLISLIPYDRKTAEPLPGINIKLVKNEYRLESTR